MQLVSMQQAVGAVSLCKSEAACTKEQGALVCTIALVKAFRLAVTFLFLAFSAVKEKRMDNDSKSSSLLWLQLTGEVCCKAELASGRTRLHLHKATMSLCTFKLTHILMYKFSASNCV